MLRVVCVLLAVCCVGCFGELYDLGLVQYKGAFTPTSVVAEGHRVVHTFETDPTDPTRGPICANGSPFDVVTRAGTTNDLVIVLPGGGVCISRVCNGFNVDARAAEQAFEQDNPGIPFSDANAVFLDYCDASLFIGDVDGPRGTQRGLQNITAAFDVAKATFPEADRIMLVGLSAGGFGTIFGAPLLRHYYPSPINVVNDSGVGVLNGDDPTFIEDALQDLNAQRFIPASCHNCLASGHATALIKWILAHGLNMQWGVLSSHTDYVMTGYFLGVPSSSYETWLLEETSDIGAAFPDKYRYFLQQGSGHTVLVPGAPFSLNPTFASTIDGITSAEWITDLVEDGPNWVNLIAAP